MTVENAPEHVLFSVDLEPNKDGSLDGVRDAMEWFDRTIPRGTVFTTYRIATEMPELVAELSESFEIGVHVHPREFGHDHDQLAKLNKDRQRELISKTRSAITTALDAPKEDITVFRAGRHSASIATFDVLDSLNFAVDASVNAYYGDYLPQTITSQKEPFLLDDGLVEIPTTYSRPRLLSDIGLRLFPTRGLTATANSLRTDRRRISGPQAVRWLLRTNNFVSFYLHPYDATDYHSGLQNNGQVFRDRFSSLVTTCSGEFITASEAKTESVIQHSTQ